MPGSVAWDVCNRSTGTIVTDAQGSRLAPGVSGCSCCPTLVPHLQRVGKLSLSRRFVLDEHKRDHALA